MLSSVPAHVARKPVLYAFFLPRVPEGSSGCSTISTALFGILAPNLYSFGDRFVIQGQFDRVLLRPVNSLCQVLFESFNVESVGSLLVGIGLFLYSSNGILRGRLDRAAWLCMWTAAEIYRVYRR